ncbi:MAG: alpha-hydroxy-acid oxidizing protein [Desulfurococcales archaeon]|nr:alpha-hydroxy-acid oxidizing protein [Desulfurococcales archaeon]
MANLASRLLAAARLRLEALRARLAGPPLGGGCGYPEGEIVARAILGRRALYPRGYGAVAFGGPRRGCRRSPPAMEDLLVLAPPAFTPGRLEVLAEKFREPLYSDVETGGTLGGFRVRLPLAVASMGSTDVASRYSLAIARGAARAGVVYGVGENVATVRGYDRRLTRGHPSLLERLTAYLSEAAERGLGGVTIQQSVEDAYDELWNRVYSDKRIDPYIDEGMVAFEVKVGQGAKPGLGGVIRVPRGEAERLSRKYRLDFDPGGRWATRYSAPATFTAEILRGMIRNMRTSYPRVRIWVKLGGFRDALEAVRIAAGEGADAVVLDGGEGGTGLAPIPALRHLGLPTIAMAAAARRARELGYSVDIMLSGGLYSGFHLVASLALGASGIAAGRPFLIAAAAAGPRGVERYVESVLVEAQMLASALGKYRLDRLGPEDLAAVDPHAARALGVAYALNPQWGAAAAREAGRAAL